jgi:hypothetical protein
MKKNLKLNFKKEDSIQKSYAWENPDNAPFAAVAEL